MADRNERLILETQGFLGSAEANYPTAIRNMALELNGHPRAQDFEPTGHGGSDPTSQSGILPDSAALDGKRVTKLTQQLWTLSRELDDTLRRHLNGVRPHKEESGINDRTEWCVLHLELDFYEPRYRNDLCRPCSERKYQTGDYPTLQDVQYHAQHARWPRKPVDPKQHVASLTRLQLGTEAITGEEAAEKMA